jgi:hypothetical protein
MEYGGQDYILVAYTMSSQSGDDTLFSMRRPDGLGTWLLALEIHGRIGRCVSHLVVHVKLARA